MRLAFADARRYVADPAVAPAPLAGCSARIHCQRRGLIRPERAPTRKSSMARRRPLRDTVYFSVVDGEGNACSFINSNYMGFGTGIVPRGWGFSLQNRGHNFSLDPATRMPWRPANALTTPSSRPWPPCAKAGELYASFGVMGGFMQPQGHMQVFIALADEALTRSRRWTGRASASSRMTADSQVSLEEGIPLQVMASLAEMGHPVTPVQRDGAQPIWARADHPARPGHGCVNGRQRSAGRWIGIGINIKKSGVRSPTDARLIFNY